jgi:hypothetical protein
MKRKVSEIEMTRQFIRALDACTPEQIKLIVKVAEAIMAEPKK